MVKPTLLLDRLFYRTKRTACTHLSTSSTFSVLLLLFLWGYSVAGYSQITYTSANNKQGNWASSSTWTFSPASETWAPASPGNPTNSNCNAINVYGYVRVESGGLTVNNANPVVTIYDTLYIVGDVTLGSGASMNVTSAGILVITGNLTLEGSFNMGNGGNVVVKGNLNVTNGTVQNNTNFYVFGSTSVSGGGHVNGCDGYGNPGGCTPVNSGNIDNATDLAAANSSLSNFVNNNGTLPVELLYVKGKQSDKNIVLRWATASQLNFDYFSVEHSVDGIIWEEIDQVKGEGTTYNLMRYELTTNRFVDGKNYYRLKSIDFDLSYEYSDVVVVQAIKEREFSVFPNPSNSGDKLSFELNFTPQDGDVAVLIDRTGDVVARIYITNFSGELNTPPLKPGLYIMRYQGVAHSTNLRLLVR